MRVDFATFCHSGDAHRLHAPGQLKRQVESNGHAFNKVILIHQMHNPIDTGYPFLAPEEWKFDAVNYVIDDLNYVLKAFDIDIEGQYTSTTDKAHHWKVHVVNHLKAVSKSDSDFIVFADNDCWMVEQPWASKIIGLSWIDKGIDLLNTDPSNFIVSPNDGEPERRTNRFSQQMFMARTREFREFNFNQPGWNGDTNIPGGPMPEYWGMLEGRMELGCRVTGQHRYVLGPEYRYWHHNRLNENGLFEIDRSKY